MVFPFRATDYIIKLFISELIKFHRTKGAISLPIVILQFYKTDQVTGGPVRISNIPCKAQYLQLHRLVPNNTSKHLQENVARRCWEEIPGVPMYVSKIIDINQKDWTQVQKLSYSPLPVTNIVYKSCIAIQKY